MATLKQKRAIANLVENGGNVSKAMRDAGYSKETAKTPQKLTESEAFKTYGENLPEELLVQKHLALLNKIDKEGEIDVNAVKSGLEMAYKIKGTYAPEKRVNVNINSEPSDRIKELAKKLRESYT